MLSFIHQPTAVATPKFLKNRFSPAAVDFTPSNFSENLCALGDGLVALHLMEKQGKKMTGYPIAGDSTVEAVSYTEPQDNTKGRVWINTTQYF